MSTTTIHQCFSRLSIALHWVMVRLISAVCFLIGLHALAALFHHYIVKDNTLLRMMPGRN